MRHTYLLEEGSWSATGVMIDDEGREIPISGSTRIVHSEDEWLIISEMTLLGDAQATNLSQYSVAPLGPGEQSTRWFSANPELGRILGTFAVVGDSILSRFESEDGRFYGTEYLQWLSPAQYLNRGVLLTQGQRISSWIVELTTIQ